MNSPAAGNCGGGSDGDRLAGRTRGLVAFADALRAGGAVFGSAALLDANAALAAVGLESRADVKAALRVTLVRDPSDLELFDLVFESFFPQAADAALVGQIPALSPPNLVPRPAERRLAESLARAKDVANIDAPPCMEADAGGTQSDLERLKERDFEQMSTAELTEVKALIRELTQTQARRRTRRSRSGGTARRLDPRAMLRHRDLDTPRYRTPVPQPRDCVLLVDVSGSMSIYSRVFLHFAHALSRCPGRVETFVFATRLSRITHTLRIAEPDLAITAAGRSAPDWDGGTRLGACLAEFNHRWGRRVLGRDARVILLSDGLERDAIEPLDREVLRLARSAHELIWLNPLLRSSQYAPLAAGAQVLARHADALRPAHNIASLSELARLLG